MAVLQRFQAVILMTGCFAPFHEGHLSTAFEFRKKWAARLGLPRTKIACLFSFCHDAYVSTKTKDWPLEKRLVAFHYERRIVFLFYMKRMQQARSTLPPY